MSQISLLIRITASPEEVYEQLTTSEGIAKWFAEASYSTDKDTAALKLTLWGKTDFIVTEQLPPSRIVWHCTSKNDPLVRNGHYIRAESRIGKNYCNLRPYWLAGDYKFVSRLRDELGVFFGKPSISN